MYVEETMILITSLSANTANLLSVIPTAIIALKVMFLLNKAGIASVAPI
jgi:hypothetical protein